MDKSNLKISLVPSRIFIGRVAIMLLLYLEIGGSLQASMDQDTLRLIVLYISAVGLYAISIYHWHMNKNTAAPIIISLIGFCFWMISLIVISYFWGQSIVDTSFVDFDTVLKAII